MAGHSRAAHVQRIACESTRLTNLRFLPPRRTGRTSCLEEFPSYSIYTSRNANVSFVEARGEERREGSGNQRAEEKGEKSGGGSRVILVSVRIAY